MISLLLGALHVLLGLGVHLDLLADRDEQRHVDNCAGGYRSRLGGGGRDTNKVRRATLQNRGAVGRTGCE